tara:strand:+ start:363 stop:587 length:225 start_codon:yes stop_codon:yes gene_type:complete
MSDTKRKIARTIARSAVKKAKALAKEHKKSSDKEVRSLGRAEMKQVREKKRQIKKNYLTTRKAISDLIKNGKKK